METTISSDEERIDSESVNNLVLPLHTQKKKRGESYNSQKTEGEKRVKNIRKIIQKQQRGYYSSK